MAKHQQSVVESTDCDDTFLPSSGLSDAEKAFIRNAEERFTNAHRISRSIDSAETRSLDEVADELLDKLRKNKKALELYTLSAAERAAAGVLSQSGEAEIFRNKKNNRVCIKYRKQGLLDILTLRTM